MTAMSSILSAPEHPLSPAALSLDQPQPLSSANPPASGADGGHPNVFVRGLPLAWGESELASVFSQYGELSSIRLVRHSMTKHSLGYGFVRYSAVQDAQAAITSLDGTTVLGHKLQVKFADADAGPPAAASPSGLTPSDSCYAKHLPASWGAREVQQLFEAHGAVLDVKLFPCLDQFRGASALIRMASVEAAERAINALNNTTTANGVQSLIVRFAESAAEKAARLQRRERQQQQQAAAAGRGQAGLTRTGLSSGSLAAMGSQGLLASSPALLSPEQQLQQALSALSLSTDSSLGLPPLGPVGMAGAPIRSPPLMRPPAAAVPMVPPIQINYQPPVLSSVSLRGLPHQADRLWVFEHFSRFGPIASLRILFDESTGLCTGSGYVHYADATAADRARQVLNGMRAGDKVLQVTVQVPPSPMALPGGMQAPAGMVGPGPVGYVDASAVAPVSAPLSLVFPPPEWESLGAMPMPAMQAQM